SATPSACSTGPRARASPGGALPSRRCPTCRTPRSLTRRTAGVVMRARREGEKRVKTARALTLASLGPLLLAGTGNGADLELDPEREYFSAPGLDVIVFDDIYPDGHQTGVTIVQHGR